MASLRARPLTAARWTWVLGLLAALGPSVGCARRTAASLPELEGGVELALRRGPRVSSMTVKLPHAIGRDVSLRLEKNRMFGTLGERRIDLTLESDSISGRISVGAPNAGGTSRDRRTGVVQMGEGRSGVVQVEVYGEGAAVEASGLWNGERLHFTFRTDGLNGMIPVILPSDITGQGVVMATNTRASCQYTLERVSAAIYKGTSSCLGIAEETYLQAPVELSRRLEPSELVALLLVLFSTPPLSPTEIPTDLR